MKFMNEAHKQFVMNCILKAGQDDIYHIALFYVLGLSEDCKRNVDTLYDWKSNCVKKLGKKSGWITSTSLKIIRLAYNLFSDGCPTAVDIEDPEERCCELLGYTPAAILSGLEPKIFAYCLEGIRIRYME
mgnify:CR=1 FL=1